MIESPFLVLAAAANDRRALSNWQRELRPDQRKRKLKPVRIAVPQPEVISPAWSDRLRRSLATERPLFAELADKGVIHPLAVEWVRPSQLQVNPRTAKMLRIVDLRIDS